MMTNTRVLVAIGLFASLIQLGCGESQPAPAQPSAPAPVTRASDAAVPESASPNADAGARASASGDGVEIGGLVWNIPAAWKDVGPSGMRIAEFKVDSGASDAAGASVRFFSTQGSAAMNIERWKGQIKDPITGPTTSEFAVGALRIFTMSATGAYSGMGPGGAPTALAENTRMLAVFVEGGEKPVQILVTGPADVVKILEEDWQKMLESVRAP